MVFRDLPVAPLKNTVSSKLSTTNRKPRIQRTVQYSKSKRGRAKSGKIIAASKLSARPPRRKRRNLDRVRDHRPPLLRSASTDSQPTHPRRSTEILIRWQKIAQIEKDPLLTVELNFQDWSHWTITPNLDRARRRNKSRDQDKWNWEPPPPPLHNVSGPDLVGGGGLSSSTLIAVLEGIEEVNTLFTPTTLWWVKHKFSND